VGQVIKVRDDDLRGELLVVAYTQCAAAPQQCVAGG
jgi:hypothetical protein